MLKKSLSGVLLSLILGLVFTIDGPAMPPTKEAIEKWIAEGVYETKVANWQAFKEAGGCAPSELSPLNTLRSRSEVGLDASSVDTLYVIVIMVEFTDWLAVDQNYAGTAHEFDSLLFTDSRVLPGYHPTGSMTDFYLENSYEGLYITGDIYGWYMMPQTYAHYVGTNDGLGGGGAELAGHAVDAAEAAGVDFSPYANGDLWVDGVIVVHAGAGAETGAYGIWSHRSNMSTRYYDGVNIRSYTMNPEEYGFGLSTMGVYGHEYGHALGLPDLYDVNDASPGNGLGDWSMMAGGSWNNNGRTPAQFDPWCKARLGFVDVIWVDSNLHQVEFPAVEYNPVVYGIRENPGGLSWEYWLIENRQRTGFDAALPGAGLCIYHFDSTVGSQSNPNRYKVAMEQADGENDLALNGGSDNGDPYPGSKNNRAFHDQSLPNSRDNDGAPTEVGVWDVSNSDSLMYADLDVEFSRPWIELTGLDSISFFDPLPGGDADGVFEAGETIEFDCHVINRERDAYGGVVTLEVDNEDVQFLQNGVALTGDLLNNANRYTAIPVQFTLPVDFESIIAQFSMTVSADSASGMGDQTFAFSFQFDHVLGAPQILIVDDDAGQSYETRFFDAVTDSRMPSEIWDKSVSSPTGADLLDYRTVIWHTGKDIGGGTLTSGDLTALKAFLDGGGSLFLNSMTAAGDLHTLDSAFMADYLHATLAGTNQFALGFIGTPGSELGDGVQFTYYGSAPINPMHDKLNAVNGGEAALYLADEFANGNFGDCGVSYSGSYRTVFTTIGFEFLADGPLFRFDDKDSLLQRVLHFFTTDYPYVRYLTLDGEDRDQVVSSTPEFAWKVQDTGALVQTQYEIEIGSDNDWATAELWVPGAVSAADTSVIYAGSPLSDGQTYFARIRTNNGSYWSDWIDMSFHMNTAPEAPIALTPADSHYTDNSPSLVILNGSDAEVTALAYEFELYLDEGLTSVAATSSLIEGGADSTSWSVTPALSELTQYWWRARTHDSAEFGDWSNTQTFIVNSAYELPSGNLYVVSTAVSPCDSVCAEQPIMVQASKPLSEAIIPIRIPENVSICGVTFSGLATESWDLNTVDIDSVTGYILVTLANSGELLLPADTTTVFTVLFTMPAPCNTSTFVSWDTVGFADAAQRLSFTDTMEVFSPVFNEYRDSTEFVAYEPGNIDGVVTVDIGDLTFMISYLYLGGPVTCVQNATDINADCEGPDIGDLTALIAFLYLEGGDPQCGCVAGAPAASSAARKDIALDAIPGDGYTDIVLSSAVELRGVEVKLSGSVSAIPTDLLYNRFNIISSPGDDILTIAVVDLDGGEVLSAGKTSLFRLDGEYEVVSGEVSDDAHSVYAASVTGSVNGEDLPTSFALEQNYPNPFNPTTRIKFALPASAQVKLEVYNVLGQSVVVLVDERLEAGYQVVEWNGRTEDDHLAASGVYFYRLRADSFVETRKMILLK